MTEIVSKKAFTLEDMTKCYFFDSPLISYSRPTGHF